jgi:hypothetical protein
LLEFCSVVGALLIDADGIYDPREPHDRLLLGMKGQTWELNRLWRSPQRTNRTTLSAAAGRTADPQ